jgi:hypothetical protein
MASTSSLSSQSSSSSGDIESPFALLSAVEAAILAVCKMQSYKLGDRMVTYADLAQLRSIRRDLKREIAALQGVKPYISAGDFRGNF